MSKSPRGLKDLPSELQMRILQFNEDRGAARLVIRETHRYDMNKLTPKLVSDMISFIKGNHKSISFYMRYKKIMRDVNILSFEIRHNVLNVTIVTPRDFDATVYKYEFLNGNHKYNSREGMRSVIHDNLPWREELSKRLGLGYVIPSDYSFTDEDLSTLKMYDEITFSVDIEKLLLQEKNVSNLVNMILHVLWSARENFQTTDKRQVVECSIGDKNVMKHFRAAINLLKTPKTDRRPKTAKTRDREYFPPTPQTGGGRVTKDTVRIGGKEHKIYVKVYVRSKKEYKFMTVAQARKYLAARKV